MQPNKENYINKSEILAALANPTRLCIVYGLFKGGVRNVSEIQGCAEVPQSSVSQHLAKLKAAGILKCQRYANEMHYYLANEEVKALIQFLFPE